MRIRQKCSSVFYRCSALKIQFQTFYYFSDLYYIFSSEEVSSVFYRFPALRIQLQICYYFSDHKKYFSSEVRMYYFIDFKVKKEIFFCF